MPLAHRFDDDSYAFSADRMAARLVVFWSAMQAYDKGDVASHLLPAKLQALHLLRLTVIDGVPAIKSSIH